MLKKPSKTHNRNNLFYYYYFCSVRIQIIAHNNQAGLTKDREIVKTLLEERKHKIFLTDKEKQECHRGKFDVNIFMEHFTPECIDKYVPQAKKNILIPNPEWFEPHWKKDIGYADLIIAKTKDCERIFNKLHKNVKFTSFTSEDKRLDIPKKREFFHSCGKSHSKGTDKIVRVWYMVQSLPKLHLCASAKVIPKQIKSQTINHYIGRMEEPEFTKLRNSCYFHLCPSIYEGFGHYIWEALSMGNIVITTNAPPMNEFIEPEYGIRMVYRHKKPMRLALASFVHETSLKRAILYTKKLSNEQLQEMSRRARQKWANNDQFFRREFIKAIEQ